MRRRILGGFVLVLGVVGCEEPRTPSKPKPKPSAAMPIRLSTGVALPQTGPDGTMMMFSVDYEFIDGEPNAEDYVWVIERAHGNPATARNEVKLSKKGNLPTPMPGWLPDHGPFHSHIEDHKGHRVSESIELR